jgi:phospholipase C
MRPVIPPLVLVSLLVVSALLLGLNGCGGMGLCTFLLPVSDLEEPAPQPAFQSAEMAAWPPQGKIEHVVIMVQENRSTDNLFHDPALIARGADIAGSGVNSKLQTVPLAPIPLGIDYDLDHSHTAFLELYNNGNMNGGDRISAVCSTDNVYCMPANPQFKYVQASDVEPYFQMAEQYSFGDRMFQTNQGPSFPAHQFLFSGTSAPTASSPFFAAENPDTAQGFNVAGCVAAADESVMLIDPNGNETCSMYPCFEHATLSDELDANNISWRYYIPSAGDIWNAPNAIHHICEPRNGESGLACTGKAWGNVILSAATVISDVAKNELRAVSWVIPSGQNSDHAGYPSTTGGPSWVAAVVNAIGNSPYWENTAIIVTWDDWGGWYDHVPPPQVLVNCARWGCGYVYGLRVPLIVISPYAKPGYISHVNHDFGSILKFVEEVYGLGSLGYADSFADDLSDCFDFGQAPLRFRTIPAPRDANYFLHDTTPPMVPDND